MKKILGLIITALASLNTMAQQLEVKEARATMDPMTVDMQRRDFNNEICALVKVMLPVAGAGFEGNVIGDTPFKINEYWVYLTAGTKFLQVKCPGSYPLRIDFRNHGINALQGKCIYELVLTGFVQPEAKQADVETSVVGELAANSVKYRYVVNLQPKIVSLIEHPFGIYIDGDPDALYKLTPEQLKQLTGQEIYKISDEDLSVTPNGVMACGMLNRLWPFKPFHDGRISRSFVFSFGTAGIDTGGVIGKSLLAGLTMGLSGMPSADGMKFVPKMGKKDAKKAIQEIVSDLASTGNYRELPMVKKGNKLYDELTHFFVNDKLGLIIKIYYKDKQIYVHRRTKSLEGTGLAEMPDEWWCGIQKPV